MCSTNTLIWRNLSAHALRGAFSAKQTLLGLEQEGLAAFADQVMGLGLKARGAVIMVTRPLIARMAQMIQLNWRRVVLVTYRSRQYKSAIISIIAFP